MPVGCNRISSPLAFASLCAVCNIWEVQTWNYGIFITASFDEICRKLDEGTFIPYHKSLIRLLFDMRKQYGASAG
jgi:hypothetical protein